MLKFKFVNSVILIPQMVLIVPIFTPLGVNLIINDDNLTLYGVILTQNMVLF